MIIDCHGHYTTEPPALHAFRKAQLAGDASARAAAAVKVSDDELRATVRDAQLRIQQERGTDLTIFSPRASGMGHHLGDFATSLAWSQASNELIHRLCTLFPRNFAGACQLPQSPGVPPSECIGELTRCIREYGFVGCNLNPDPSGGQWTGPPLTDRAWYPLYEALVELDVPAMVHVSASCNPHFHTTGAHYINADTTAFMQLLMGDVFRDFPTLRLIIPHGGGAVPFHWGRYRGLAIANDRPPLADLIRDHVYFDTCVYHQPGIDLLARVIPVDNILFASEMLGAVKGIDPESGHAFDDTRRYVEALPLSTTDKEKIFSGNAKRVYPGLGRVLARRESEAGAA